MVEDPKFQDNRHRKVVRLSPPFAFTPRKYSWFSLLLQAASTQCHSATGRIMSMKNSDDTIGDRTRDLPACSAVPQPTALLRAPKKCGVSGISIEETENAFSVFVGNQKKRDHIEEMGVDVDIILKMPLYKWCRMAWIWFMWLRTGASVLNRITNQRFPQYFGNF